MSDDQKKPFNNPFGALKEKLGELPSKPLPVAAPKAAKGPARAVVRMERKGHGGKEVTVIEQLELPARQLDGWLKELKTSLGCGGRIDEGAIVVQGDQRDRVRDWLAAKGVRKISVG